MIDRKFKVKIESRDFRKFRRRDSESDRFQYLFLDSEFRNNFQTIFVRSFLKKKILEKKIEKMIHFILLWPLEKQNSNLTEH